METKDFKIQVKTGGDQSGMLVAYASTYGNVDSVGDIVLAGAFDEAIARLQKAGRKLPMLWSHSDQDVIGYWEKFASDSVGLKVTGQLLMGVAKAKEVYEAIKAGAINSFSIGYSVDEATYNPEGYRLLKKLSLFEISPVVFPANESALLVSAKGKNMRQLKGEYEEGPTNVIRNLLERLRTATSLEDVKVAADDLEKLMFWFRVPENYEEDLRSIMLTADGQPAVPTYATPGKARFLQHFLELQEKRGRSPQARSASRSSSTPVTSTAVSEALGVLKAESLKGDW